MLYKRIFYFVMKFKMAMMRLAKMCVQFIVNSQC